MPSYLRDKLHIAKQALKTAQNKGVYPVNENPTLGQAASPDKGAFSASKRTDTCILILTTKSAKVFSEMKYYKHCLLFNQT